MNQPLGRDFLNRYRTFGTGMSPPPRLSMAGNVLLYVEDLTVSFDGFRALDGLTLYVDEGELRCLIGANGAGKTTLMDVITGKTACDSGTAWFGRNIDLLAHDEAEIARFGVGRKFQKPTVFEPLTVFENLELSVSADRGVWSNLFARLDGEQRDLIDHTLELIGLKSARQQQAAALSHGQKQWLEIGMLLVSKPKLLLIDEPVAGMTAEETERTAELLLSLQGDHTVVVVEHDMEFVRSIARTVTVLHQGSVLTEGSMEQVQAHPDVIRVYLGEEAE